MGFIARTIFWLGLVYSAMSLDFGSEIAERATGLAEVNPLAACAGGVTEDCRRRVGELRKALDSAAARGLADRVVSATEALVTADPPTPPRKPADMRSF